MGAGDEPNVRRLIAQTFRDRLAMPRKSSEPIVLLGDWITHQANFASSPPNALN